MIEAVLIAKQRIKKCFYGFFPIFLCALILCASNSYAQSAFDDPGARVSGKGGGDLTAVETKIDAGSVALGSASQVVVLMRNESAKPIKSGSISLYPSSNVSASVGENECVQQDLPPSAACAIAVSVKGLQPGRFRIEMLMRHDGRSKLLTSTISGIVERSNDDSADIISDIDTIPSELKFDKLKESRPLTRSVILRNVTSKEINITSMDIEANEQAGYSLKSTCQKLLSGEACIATVTWAPKQKGPATGVLVVSHDGPTGVVSVILDGSYEPTRATEVGIFPEAVPGKGLLTASQSDVDFGRNIESSSAITVSLVNVGDSPLTIEGISLANNDNGIDIDDGGCKSGVILDPVEACPLTLTWDPVRSGSILDDVQIVHDGARGILVLPIRGQADKAVNKDSQAIVMNNDNTTDVLASIPAISAKDVEAAPPREVAPAVPPSSNGLEGFKVTSLAANRAIISGPGGSRVVNNNQETVIGGVMWRIAIRPNAVELFSSNQRVLLLFDHSLSFSNDGNSTSSAVIPTTDGG